MPLTGESNVIDTILNRRSVREFTDKTVSNGDINKSLTQAAGLLPVEQPAMALHCNSEPRDYPGTFEMH